MRAAAKASLMTQNTRLQSLDESKFLSHFPETIMNANKLVVQRIESETCRPRNGERRLLRELANMMLVKSVVTFIISFFLILQLFKLTIKAAVPRSLKYFFSSILFQSALSLTSFKASWTRTNLVKNEYFYAYPLAWRIEEFDHVDPWLHFYMGSVSSVWLM